MKLLRRAISFLLVHLYARNTISRLDRATVLGFSLEIVPGVFHPKLFFSSKIFGRYLSSLALSGKRILDMGTGSGILAMCAARAGAEVVAVDVDQTAVDCARKNVSSNNLAHRIEVRQGDLFDSINPEARFDYIVWNPPFYPRDQLSRESLAWNAGAEYAIIQRFARASEGHLERTGRILLILSSDVALEKVLDMFTDLGFRHCVVLQTRRLFERFMIYEFDRI